MLLTADRDRLDRSGKAGLRQGRTEGGPPAERVGLARAVRAGHHVRGVTLRDNVPGVRVDDHDLGGLRRAVNSRDQRSARHLTSG